MTEKIKKGAMPEMRFLIPVLIVIVIWVFPHPAAIHILAWHMLALFVATIVAFILKPMPIGAIAIIALTMTLVTKTVPTDVALASFGDPTIWLIVMAFFISRGFIKTGFGSRIAYLFVRLFGRKTLGLSYALLACDLILSPATPSNTARAGGILYPIIQSLADSFGSKASDHTQRKMGSFLIYSAFQGNLITSAMFITAMAANPLATTLAASMGVHISWMGWLMASLVPGLISLITVPWLIYRLYPPEIKESPDAVQFAETKLQKMGPLSKSEKSMLFCFIVILILWITGSLIGVDATVTALIGLSLLLLLHVLNWEDVRSEKGAWNTLIWFAVLIMMADELNKMGLIPWFSQFMVHVVHGLSWPLVLLILVLVYFYSHYLFASATAHVSAMYGAFLGVAIASGVPAMLAALVFGFMSNLMGSTSHYGMGPAPILFGSGYVSQGKWWSLNLVLSIVYMIIWLGIGGFYWHLIGIF
ncbi:anion permease [Sporolactobacillus pectinivorans]|uniref:anion permease n=1 Tax=Sporolactobacillus pectinivorans TaxID=1591408 RepID=UPI001EFD0487|nr:anion permease [Sporolactobacillus pectinivorans]